MPISSSAFRPEVFGVVAEETHGVGLPGEDGEVLVLQRLEEPLGHVRLAGNLVDGQVVALAGQSKFLTDRFHSPTLPDRRASPG